MNDILYRLASHICGQVNVSQVGGHALPLCHRCTGLYAGAAFAAVLLAMVRPAFTRWMFAVHAAMIVAMIPLGYHWVRQSADVRTLSGFAYGVGLVYFLSMAKRNSESRARALAPLVYLATLTMCAAVLMAGLYFGTDGSARAIVLLYVGGFVALVVMSVQAVASFFRKPAVKVA